MYERDVENEKEIRVGVVLQEESFPQVGRENIAFPEWYTWLTGCENSGG